MFASDGTVRAAIGQNQVGTGTVQVADLQGAVRAVLTVEGGKGHADIFNGRGVSVVWLTEGSRGGGNLLVTAASFLLLPLYVRCLSRPEYGTLDLFNRLGEVVKEVLA